jgi:Ca2+-binding EF-hand superfamily protein
VLLEMFNPSSASRRGSEMMVHNPTERADQQGTHIIRLLRSKIYEHARNEGDQTRVLTKIFRTSSSEASANSKLNYDDFRHLLRVTIGINPSHEECGSLFEQMASPDDGMVSLLDFKDAILNEKTTYTHELAGRTHIDQGLTKSGSALDYELVRGGARAPRAKAMVDNYYGAKMDEESPTMPDATTRQFFAEAARRFWESPNPNGKQQLRLQLQLSLREYDARGDGLMSANDFRCLLHNRFNLKATDQQIQGMHEIFGGDEDTLVSIRQIIDAFMAFDGNIITHADFNSVGQSNTRRTGTPTDRRIADRIKKLRAMPGTSPRMHPEQVLEMVRAKALARMRGQICIRREFMVMFRRYDLRVTGVIDADDLRCILHDITDFVVTAEQLEAIMELCGGHGDGTLTMETFVQGLLFHENREAGERFLRRRRRAQRKRRAEEKKKGITAKYGSAERPNPATLQNWHHGGSTFMDKKPIVLEEQPNVPAKEDADLAIDPMTELAESAVRRLQTAADDTDQLSGIKGVGGGVDASWTSPSRARQKLQASRSMDSRLSAANNSSRQEQWMMNGTLLSERDYQQLTGRSNNSQDTGPPIARRNSGIHDAVYGEKAPKKKVGKIVAHNESGRSLDTGLSRSPTRGKFPKWMTQGQ